MSEGKEVLRISVCFDSLESLGGPAGAEAPAVEEEHQRFVSIVCLPRLTSDRETGYAVTHQMS
eukprot:1663143-Pyramimonas_sp.AAC.1